MLNNAPTRKISNSKNKSIVWIIPEQKIEPIKAAASRMDELNIEETGVVLCFDDGDDKEQKWKLIIANNKFTG